VSPEEADYEERVPDDVPTCSSEGGETRRSRIEGGGKGKLLDLLAGKVVDAEDSRESGGGEIGNWIGETGATCWDLR